MSERIRYTPRLSLLPIKRVRWRSSDAYGGTSRRRWKLYIFGLLPFGSVPRRGGDA